MTGGAWHPAMTLPSNRRWQRSELRPHPNEEAMSHALPTVLHRGRKAASNVMAACLATSRGARRETAKVRQAWLPPGRLCGAGVPPAGAAFLIPNS